MYLNLYVLENGEWFLSIFNILTNKGDQMKRRESDRVELIKNESRKVKKEFIKDPKIEGLILQLGETENKKVLLACGDLLLHLELNQLIKSQEKDKAKEVIIYEKMKAEIYKILEDLSSTLTYRDFDFIKNNEKEAIIRVLNFLIEKNKEGLLLEIAKKSNDDYIAKHVAWYFIRKGDNEKIREINAEAICLTIKNLTAQKVN